jgi:site-specific recombinase XerD
MPARSRNPYKRAGSPLWQIRFRDASGRDRRESAKTTSLRIAQQVLANRRLEVQQARAGVLDRFATARRRPLEEFVQEYKQHLVAGSCSKTYVDDVVKQVREAIAATEAATLQDLSAGAVEAFLDRLHAERRFSAKTMQTRYATLRTFGRWLLDSRRWPENPFASLRRMRGKTRDGDRKFRRRSLTLKEVELLADSAPVRHLQSYAASHGGRSSAHAEEYSRIGRERALLYWFAATTGLRASEIAAVRWEDLHDLDGDDPRVVVPGAFTKNRQDAHVPLQRFVAAGLVKLREARGAAQQRPVQQGDRALHVPERIAEHVRRDAMHAGLIPKHRPADHRLDFHALRHSCVRILRDLGVPVEVAQRFLRHSDVRLTLQTYGSVQEDVVRQTMRDLVPVPAMFREVCQPVCRVGGPKKKRRGTSRDDAANDGGSGSDARTAN